MKKINKKYSYEGKLKKSVIKEIEKARERYKRGEYYTSEEMTKRLGL